MEVLEESFREACSVLVLFAVALRGAKLYAVAPRISQNCAASFVGDVVQDIWFFAKHASTKQQALFEACFHQRTLIVGPEGLLRITLDNSN